MPEAPSPSPPANATPERAKSSEDRDLTQAPLLQTVVRMGIPSAIGFSAQTVFTLVNLFWVGRLGTTAIAGVTVFSTLLAILWAFNEMIGAGSVPIISRRFGEHDEPGAIAAIYQTLFFKFGVALLVGGAGALCASPLVHMMNATGAVAQEAIAYGRLASLNLPLLYCMVTIWTVLRAAGRAATAMRFMLGSVALNMVLDPLLMLGMGLGVRGAAIANTLTSLLFLLTGIAYLASGRAGFRLPLPPPRPWIRWRIVSSIVRIGFPATIESMARAFALTWCVSRIANYGPVAVAATGIAQRVVDLGTVVAVGFSLGTVPIVGQCLGSGQPQRAAKAAKVAAGVTLAIVAPLVLLEELAAEPLVRLFGSTGAALAASATAVRMLAPIQVMLAVQLPLGSSFFGAGNTVPTMVLGVAFGAMCPVLLVLAGQSAGIGSVQLVWGALLVAYAAEMMAFIALFRRGAWMRVRL